jgi:hypothetical protein
MDYWFEIESRMRRDHVVETARSSRMIRVVESGRSTSVRTRIANGAQALSDALATVARVLRAGNA